jgi:hypothetical protein
VEVFARDDPPLDAPAYLRIKRAFRTKGIV